MPQSIIEQFSSLIRITSTPQELKRILTVLYIDYTRLLVLHPEFIKEDSSSISDALGCLGEMIEILDRSNN